MKKLSLILLCCVSLFTVCTPASATFIDYAYAIDGTTLTSPYSWAVVETFNSVPLGVGNTPVSLASATGFDQLWDWSTSPNGAVVINSAANLYAAPYNTYSSVADATNYVTVPQNTAETELWAMVDFGDADNHYLGMFWGSVDTYNTLTFLNNGTVIESWTGSQVTAPSAANGNQTAPGTNFYVNFYNVPAFDQVKFTSTQYALEFDNLAIVPIPATVLLGLLGLGIGGWKLRKSI